MAFARLLATKGRWAFEGRKANISAGNIASLVDLADPAHLAIVTGTLPAATVHAPLGGALSVNPTGTQVAKSNRAPSAFRPEHSGSGVEVYHVFAPTVTIPGAYFALHATRNTLTGGVFLINSANGSPATYITNGGAVAFQADPVSAGSVPNGVGAVAGYRLESAASPQAAQIIKAVETTTGVLSSPAAGDPEDTLTLFGSPNGALFMAQLRWFGAYSFLPLTPAERAVFYAYVRAETGVTAP